MPAIVPLLAGNWKLLLALVAVAAACFGIYRFEKNIRDAAFEQFYAAEVREALAEKDREIARLKKLQEADRRAVATITKRERETREATHRLLDALKLQEDGPLAPVLRETLRRFREMEANEAR
jgi:hypothetical protein